VAEVKGPSDFTPEFQKAFYDLYSRLRTERFEPALTILKQTLEALLNAKFSASPRLRLRVEQGRVKSPNRLLLKAQLPKYRAEINTPDDIFAKIHDIVGTRITRNTTNDAYSVLREIKTAGGAYIFLAARTTTSRRIFDLLFAFHSPTMPTIAAPVTNGAGGNYF